MKVALASDHRGFPARQKIASILQATGHEVFDFGCDSAVSCDYPDHGLKAAQAISNGTAELGILICGTGIGMSIAANKVSGVRAALCHDELTAEMSRRHNDANALCLPGDLLGDELIKRVVDVWLNARFEGGRHKRRVDKINEYETNGCCSKDGKRTDG